MFFRPKGQLSIHTDVHSHLIPDVDDGVKSVDESIEIILAFQKLGYERLITTPHISKAYYPNSVSKLKASFEEVCNELKKRNIEMDLKLGAEYMVDQMFLTTIKNDDELLTWNNHILIETSFNALPWILNETIFEIQSRGIIPVLAHPERYPYLYMDFSKIAELRSRGMKFQVTIGSLQGQYGRYPQKMARKFLSEGWIDFLGSDVHKLDHIDHLKKGLSYRKLRGMTQSQFENSHLV